MLNFHLTRVASAYGFCFTLGDCTSTLECMEINRCTRNFRKMEIPDHKHYSALLKKINTNSEKFLVFLNEAKNKIEYTHIKKKAL